MFFLTSCAFQLQGEMPLAPPLKRMHLQAIDTYSYLTRSLQQYLKMSNVTLVSNPLDADTIFVILRDENSQEFLGVSQTTQTRQYNLIVTVEFEINNAQGQTIVPPQRLTEVRTITMQSNQILGSNNEAYLYYQQMRRAIAYSIMNRISSKEVTEMIQANFKQKPAH
ncbi:MAG: hypothetical protein A3F14_04105 [Gammaproteobacteria bacterium RIFCSPHIGHO2_12_FULL_43_28]|nr:MAG: hypothetical protein A3F14_04105 [Gammaproteobacteria bacterium RIFCSPHIGHO2_12_FULL_43_28]